MNWFWDNILLKKEERIGMFLFVCILFCLTIVKWYIIVWYEPPGNPYDEDIFANMEYTLVEPARKEDIINRKSYPKNENPKKKNKIEKHVQIDRKVSAEKKTLFFFDPNSLSPDSLELLGLGQYASTNIVKYRSKGGKFYRPNDLQKIYGIDSSIFKKILPFVKIKTAESSLEGKAYSKKARISVPPAIELHSIDINIADTTAFKKLKGIGSVYANRIVKFRNSLGGYFSIDQIKEVWGISDSLFTAIKPYLTVDTSAIEKRNINLLKKEELVRHPYIDWKKAKVIFQYKKMHGDYKSMEDFRKMHGISQSFVDTLNFYFRAE